MPLLLVAVGLLAHARLTRLAVADRISQPVRAAIVRRFGPSSTLGYLAHCRWCAGLWLAIPVAAAVVTLIPSLAGAGERTLLGALLALAYSQTTGLLARAEGDE